jgi:hypothetical protein
MALGPNGPVSDAVDRARVRQGALILSLALAAVAQCRLASDHPDGGWIIFGATVPLFLFAVRGQVPPIEPAWSDESRTAGRPRWDRWRLAAIALAVAGNGSALWLLWRDNTGPAGFWLWLLGLGLAVLAAPGHPSPRPASRLVGVALPVALLILALFLRVYRIGDLPPGIFIDETNAALDALEILDGAAVSPFATGWFQTPTLYAYYMAGLFRLLGVTFFALKLASILPGLLTAAAMYPLARRFFGSLPASLSLFFLAAARWHVHMSRWGWNALMPPLFQVLVALFLLRGLETRRPRDFALSGLALGLSQYTYLAARLIPAMVLLFLLHQLLTVRGFLRRHGGNVLLLGLVSLMAFAPLGLTYLKEPFLFTNRARQVSLLNDLEAAGGVEPLWRNGLAHLRMFSDRGDPNPRHNLPGAPMLDPFVGALVPLAAGYALWRWRDRRYALLLLWIGVALLGGVLSAAEEAPQGYRTLGALPPLLLLAADLLARLRQSFSSRGGIWRGAATAILVVFLTLSLAHNVFTYFVTYAQSGRTFWAFSPMETSVARKVAATLDERDVHVVPKLAYFSSLRFATYTRPDRGGGGLSKPPYRLFSPVVDLPLRSERGALIVLETQYLSLAPFIGHFHPGAVTRLHRAPDGQPLYVAVEVPPTGGSDLVSEPPPGEGLLGRYFWGTAWRGDPALQRIDPLLLFHWDGADPLPGPFSVRWEGELLVPDDGEYFFALAGDDGVRLWIDGRLAGASMQPDASNAVEVRLPLAAGPHPIRIDYFQRSGAKLIEFRWARPGEGLELVPPHALRPPGEPD